MAGLLAHLAEVVARDSSVYDEQPGWAVVEPVLVASVVAGREQGV